MVTKQHAPTLIYCKTFSTFQHVATDPPNIQTGSLTQYWTSLIQQTCNNNKEIVIFFSFHTDPPLPPQNAVPFWLNLHPGRPATLHISSTCLSIPGYKNSFSSPPAPPLPTIHQAVELVFLMQTHMNTSCSVLVLLFACSFITHYFNVCKVTIQEGSYTNSVHKSNDLSTIPTTAWTDISLRQ